MTARFTCFALIILLFSFAVFTGPSQAATYLVEAEDSGSVARTGTWTSSNNSIYSGGSYLHSQTPGSKLSLEFTGTSISILFIKNRAGAKADISIDGAPYPSFDGYDVDQGYPSNGIIYREVIIDNNLSLGTHTIEVTVSSTYSPWIKYYTPTLYVDAFKYSDDNRSAVLGKVYDVDCPGVGLGGSPSN